MCITSHFVNAIQTFINIDQDAEREIRNDAVADNCVYGWELVG